MKSPRVVVLSATCVTLAVTLVTLIAGAHAQTRKEKPRVPPGVDPGGVAIAIIGNGIDYTRPEIAARLARDGEGEIVGWDFVDDDRRPFERCDLRSIAAEHCNETPLQILISKKVRVIPLRAQIDKPQSLVNAVRYATKTGARIVFVGLPAELPSRFIDDAAGFHSAPLFIATVAADPKTPPYRFALGANFVIANGAADGKARIAAEVADLLGAAVECASRGIMTAEQIRDCAVATPPSKP